MKQKAYYPINLDLEGRRCVVVGGGAVAERKVRTLLAFKADVMVVSLRATPWLKDCGARATIACIKKAYQKSHLKGAFLVIAATDDPKVNQLVARHAHARNMLVNVVDVPELCNFIVPAFFRRGSLVMGISTGGQSPVAAQKLKGRCEKCIGTHFADFVEMLGTARKEVKKRYDSYESRKAVYQRIVDSPLLDLLAKKKTREARALVAKIIKAG